MFREADLIVGVGGGYMRGANLPEAAKMVLAHIPQLAAASRTQVRAVYLPQSVGALRWGTAALVRYYGRKISWHVRDDRSFTLLRGIEHVQRTPDSAVLPLGVETVDPAKVVSRTPTPLATYGIVARGLHSTRRRMDRYIESICRTAKTLQAEPLLQASARGNNDGQFYKSNFKMGAERTLSNATVEDALDRPSVVISVRLHGAIQSIRNGVPAIHLSYERKGWGAFEDLGIAEYVHNVFDFDPEAVCRQARHLASDSSGYWSAIASRGSKIEAARDALLDDLRATGNKIV